MVYSLTSTPADLKWQLHEIGIDYAKIGEFELFYRVLTKGYSLEKTSIIFGTLDFTKFELCMNRENDSIVLYDPADGIVIDEYTYVLITEILRKIHGLHKNMQLPGNESTKQILLEDAREEYLLNKTKESHSQLKNLISAMINCEGFKYSHRTIWDMKIYAFMDSVKRVSKIKNAQLLLQSGYSGFGVSLKELDNKQIDWLGELE